MYNLTMPDLAENKVNHSLFIYLFIEFLKKMYSSLAWAEMIKLIKTVDTIIKKIVLNKS